MTRQHFNAIAETIRIQLRLCDSDDACAAVLAIAEMLCDDFKIANSGVDRERFLAALRHDRETLPGPGLRESQHRRAGSVRLGLDAQHPAIETESTRRGWTLANVADDIGSGGSMNGRHALAATLEALDCGEPGALVVARLDRLSRSTADSAALIERARKRGLEPDRARRG